MNARADPEPVLLSWAEYVKFEEVYEGRRHELVRGRVRLVRTGSDTGYYPDLLVRCGAAADRLFEDDARLIVEVLSPSNDLTDLTERLYAYQGLASIETILFVNHQQRFVTVHRRTCKGWTEFRVTDAGQRWDGDLRLAWAQVWADVDAEATTD